MILQCKGPEWLGDVTEDSALPTLTAVWYHHTAMSPHFSMQAGTAACNTVLNWADRGAGNSSIFLTQQQFLQGVSPRWLICPPHFSLLQVAALRTKHMISPRPVHIVRLKAPPELAALLKSNQVLVLNRPRSNCNQANCCIWLHMKTLVPLSVLQSLIKCACLASNCIKQGWLGVFCWPFFFFLNIKNELEGEREGQ